MINEDTARLKTGLESHAHEGDDEAPVNVTNGPRLSLTLTDGGAKALREVLASDVV